MLDLLLTGLGLGTTAAGVVVAVRALPPVQRAMFAQKKPWACDVCMSFWTVGALGLLGVLRGFDVLACGPAYPVALLVLRKLGEPMHPPVMPPLD